MGTGVGQVGAFHGNMNTLAHQGLGWHLWQVPAAPKPPPVRDTTKRVGGALQPWLAIRLGDGNSKNKNPAF